MAFAEGSDNTGTMSFRTAVLNAMGNWNEDLTYIFEYCGPANQIVTPYEAYCSGRSRRIFNLFSGDALKFVEYQNLWNNFKKELKDTQILLSGIVSQKEY
jgi:hypothetical protein